MFLHFSWKKVCFISDNVLEGKAVLVNDACDCLNVLVSR